MPVVPAVPATRRVVAIAASLFVVSVVAAGCTQPVESESSSEALSTSSTAPAHSQLPFCGPPTQGPPTGVLAKLTPRVPGRLWQCPSVDRQVGLFSAEYVAWMENYPLQCGCGTTERELLPIEFAREWNDPELTDEQAPYCIWFMQPGETYAQLQAAVSAQVSSLVQYWPIYEVEAGICTHPGPGSCPACITPKKG
jgi:hypothetical protein